MPSLGELIAPRRMGSDFRWLLASSWTSNVGDGVALAAAPLLIASMTSSPILVAAGAGGHAGRLSPFALVQEVSEWFEGPVVLSGAIANGRSVLAAQAMGADLAYIGSPFIATDEANAAPAYKQGIVDGTADDIVYSNLFTGVHGNYLKASIVNAGLDPDNLPESDPSAMNFGGAKAWKDIWGSGQGIGAVHAIEPATVKIERMKREYAAARAALCG